MSPASLYTMRRWRTLPVCVHPLSVCVHPKEMMMTTLMTVRITFKNNKRNFYTQFQWASSSKSFFFPVAESSQIKRAFGPVTNLLRLRNYRIDYSQVDPHLHQLLVTKKKQNTNSFYNLLRYNIFDISTKKSGRTMRSL